MGTKLDSPEVLSFLVVDDVVYQKHPSYDHNVLFFVGQYCVDITT